MGFEDDDARTQALLRAAMENAPSGSGGVRSALATAASTMKRRYYGKGPTASRAWLVDDYAFVALEGGLTASEEVLVADGKESLVREYRLAFQASMTAPMLRAVSTIVGREALTYHSQIVFDPPRTFEIFVLGAEVPEAR